MTGEDSLQALQLTLTVLDAELAAAARERGGTLYEDGEPFLTTLSSGLRRHDG